MSIFQFFNEGVWHIWEGVDHILFLVTLLLPAVVYWENGQWVTQTSFRKTIVEVVRVITCFTVTHSIMLILVATGTISVNEKFVEVAIAASVALTAINNIFPVITKRRWLMPLIFGLVHGCGFADIFSEFGESARRVSSVLVFNVGVEAGQLTIVAVVLPLIFLLRDKRIYKPWILEGGSWVTAGIASLWVLDRIGDFGFMPF